MSRKRIYLTAILILGVSLPCVTEAARWVVPAAAHASGAQGTNWRTDLRLVNPTEDEISVRVYLLPAETDNSALSQSVVHAIASHGQVVLEDVLATAFAFDGTAGMLVESSEPELVVTSRTFNLLGPGNVLDLPTGSTFGQFIPGVPVSEALAANEQGHIVYLAQSNDFRANLGFAAASAQGGRITVNLYGSGGALLGTASRDFDGFEQFQFNRIFDIVGAPDSTAARAVVSATAPVVAYASVIDDGTGDPVAVMAQRASEAKTDLAIAAAARAPGAEDSLWRSDLRIFNPGLRMSTVTLAYSPKGVPNPTISTVVVTVGPGAVLALDDVMLSEFGFEEANGGLHITANSAVMVWSRTYNQTSLGTFGQSIPAVPVGEPLADGRMRVYTGLSNIDFRSNVGFFNLEATPAPIDVALLAADGGVVAERTFNLGGGEMDQINVFNWMNAGSASGDVYTLTIQGEADVATFVSIIDQNSGDPVYESGADRAVDSGGGGGGGGGNGECVNIGLVAEGTVVTWDFSGVADGTAFQSEFMTTYVDIGQTESTTESVTTTEFGGFETITETTTTQSYELLSDPEGYIAIEEIVTHSETTVGGFTTVIDTTLTNDPPQLNGPATRWCEGDEWSTPVVTQTVESSVGPTTVGPSPTYDGVVLSIDDVITTPAGTFTTVKSQRTGTSGEENGWVLTTWIDIATGVMVRQQIRDADGTAVADYELTGLE